MTADAERRVRRDIARLQQGSPGLRHIVVQLLAEAYKDDHESVRALQELLIDKNPTDTGECTPADATLAPTIIRLLDKTGAASHLSSERIASALKTILRPAYEQDPKRTTQLAKRLWQQQRGYPRAIAKDVYEHYDLTRLLEGYLEGTDRTESNGVTESGREGGNSA